MKVEVPVLGSPSLIVLMVSLDVNQHNICQAQVLCESRGGRPGLPVPNSPYGLFGRKSTFVKLRCCVKVEVDVLGSPSLIVLMVSLDVNQHNICQAQVLCESRGGRPGLPVPNSPYGLFGRKST